MKKIRVCILLVLMTTSACSLVELFTSVNSAKVETLIGEVNRRSGIEAAGYVRKRVQEVQRSPVEWVLVGRLFEEAFESEPDNPYLYYGVSYWLSVGGHHQESNEILRELIKTHPDLPYVRLSLGYNHMELERNREATAFLEEEAKLFGEVSPDIAFRVHNNLGLCYDDLKEYEKGIFHFEKAMAVNPNHPYGYQNIGGLYQQLKDWDKAIEYGRKAIELNSYPAAHQSLGLAYLGAKDYERAAEQLEIAVEQLPTYKSAWLYLAARGRSTFSELRWYPPMEAAKGSLSWVFRAKHPESVRTGP